MENKNIRFFMKQISVEQFAILTDDPPAVNDSIELKTKVSFKLSKTEQCVASVVKLKFNANNNPFIILDVMCTFKVYPSDWNSLITDNKITIPSGFLRHITMHTVGTARGILFCKTELTPFNKFILPPINIVSIITEDIIVEATDK